MYKKIVERTRSARPKKKVAKKSLTSTTRTVGVVGESEKNCYKWQLATPFDGGKEHTEGGDKKRNTNT